MPHPNACAQAGYRPDSSGGAEMADLFIPDWRTQVMLTPNLSPRLSRPSVIIQGVPLEERFQIKIKRVP